MDPLPTYRIIRTKKRKKTLSLYIEHDGLVVIRSPLRVPVAEVENFLTEKKAWLSKKLSQLTAQRREKKAKEFVSGEDFSYLGDRYELVISLHADHERPFFFADHRFHLDQRHQGEARDLLIAWYRGQAEIKIHERVQFYSQKMLLFPRRERITSARCQWGGCSATDSLSFSWRLIMAPLHVIDYLVVHELAHIKEKNHSPRFWEIVESNLPDYRPRREWLKRHGWLLDL